MEDLIFDGIIKKMAHQIEMSTAEAPAVNVFRQNVNFFGKSIPLKTTFTFGAAQQNSNMSNASSTRNSDAGKRNPEVNMSWTPYNELMASPVNRGETFITWPKEIAQKPAEMVASGFYYTGRGDVVQCFYCGIFLKHWTPTDVAESEHAKHALQCKYVKMFCCRK